MKRIIAVNSNSYHGYSLEEALEGISRAGFHYIELTATKGWTEHVSAEMTFEYLLTLKNKMRTLKLIPFALSGHCNLMDKTRLKDFKKNIELAHFFEANYIVSSIGEAHINDEEKVTEDQLVENIKTLIPMLEQYKIKLVLETHGEHSTGKIIKKIVDQIHSKYVSINYDTANVIFYGNVLPEEDMKTCLDQISYIHLKDKKGKYNEWNFPALGAGQVNFKEIFALLEESKNNSPFSIEIEFTKEGPGSLEEVNKAVKNSAQYLLAKGFEL